ncbi:glycosyltransferase [Corallococcus carmarthensis]|nr:glycosyltransferase [Corallococcus carmarthensis]NOK15622.1 glycosyltransferase family 1 protein [Corallococcus carmarthensis]
MAKLMIFPLPHTGHLNPCLRLADELQRLGHQVVFCCMLAAEQAVRAAGFEFVPIFESSLARDYLVQASTRMGRSRSLLGLLSPLRDSVRSQNAMFQALLDGELDRTIERIRPDLILFDERFKYAGPAVHASGIPFLRLHTTVPLHFREHLFGQPVRRPKPVMRVLAKAIHGTLVGLGLHARFEFAFETLLRQKNLGTPGNNPFHGVGGVNELMLFPEAFANIAGTAAAARIHHVGPCINQEHREAQPFAWERLREDRPLIVFSMGTRGYVSKWVPPLLRAMVDVAKQRPDWQFVMGTGTSADPATLDGRAPNLIAVQSFPQLPLLRRAAVMVTHAGFNTVKECIWEGVPMVALPLTQDQPFVARIVDKHGIGVMAPPRELGAPGLLALLDKVLGDPSYKQAVTAMSARFHEADRPEPLEELVQRMLRQHREVASPTTEVA